MTLSDKITSSRLVLAPIFFIIYLLPGYFPLIAPALWTIPVLWVLFIFSEVSDLLDGMIARKRGEVSDFGKLYDPFADTITQVTLFFCFIIDGIFPAFLFLLLIYREFGILFIRTMLLKKGIALAARMSGKIKTVAYIISVGLALLASSIARLELGNELYKWSVIAANVVFVLAVIIALVSFMEYFFIFLKNSYKK